jgi:hypothetical protein
MNYLILIVLILIPFTYAGREMEDVKQSLRVLIKPLLQKSNIRSTNLRGSKFDISACEKHKIDWGSLLMMKESPSIKYKFAPGCDIEGVINPKLFTSFPVNLKLRNLEDFTHLESENKITSSIESLPVLNLDVRSASLISPKGKIKFEADYAVRMNPLNQKNPIEENLGGEIRIVEIYNKKVDLREKVKIQ